MKIVTAISLALALACVVSVHYADAECNALKDCTACKENEVKGGCVWCSMVAPFPDGSGELDTTIGFCDKAAGACSNVDRAPNGAYFAFRELIQLARIKPLLARVDTCPATDKAIGTPISEICNLCVADGNSFCYILTGYPGLEEPTNMGGFCLTGSQAVSCTPAILPMYSKLFPGATLTMSVLTDETTCCSVNRTCFDCPPDEICSWCALELTDGAEDSKHVAGGFGICVPFNDVPGDSCPGVPPQLSAMTSGLSLAPAVGWATRYIPFRDCGYEVQTYSTDAWSSFKTRAACDSNPNTAWCDLTGVARTDGAATTPLNSGGICMDLFASGSCHAGWYLCPSPTVGFEMDGSFQDRASEASGGLS